MTRNIKFSSEYNIKNNNGQYFTDIHIHNILGEAKNLLYYKEPYKEPVSFYIIRNLIRNLLACWFVIKRFYCM